MTDINALRERVEAAEQRFGLMDEQQRHYSERVIGLIETIEAQLQAARAEIEKQIDENRRLGRDLAAARGEIEQSSAENGQLVQDLTTARAEIEQQTGENLRLSQENEELRGMLHSVLRSIEQKTHMKTLQDLEARVSALVASPDTPTAAATAAEADGLSGVESVLDGGEIPDEADAVVDAQPEMPADAAVIVEAAEGTDGDGTEVSEPAVADQDDISVAESPDAAEAVAEDTPADEPAMEQPSFEETAEAADGPDESEAEPEAESEPEAQAEPEAEEGDDLFAAIAELNAQDEAFVEQNVDEPAAPEAEMDAPEEDSATDAESANDMADAAAAAEPAAATDDGMAPTVKEIIRRVGDLARELERAEAARRASRAAEAPPAEPEHPPFDQAANG